MGSGQGVEASTLAIVVALFVAGNVAALASAFVDSLLYTRIHVTVESVVPATASTRPDAPVLVFVAVNTLLAAVLLRALLRVLAGLELSVGGALVTLIVGAAVGIVVKILLRPVGGAVSAMLTPVAVVATYAVEASLGRSLARRRSRAPRSRPPPRYRRPADPVATTLHGAGGEDFGAPALQAARALARVVLLSCREIDGRTRNRARQ
jgi:hypothetical protein